MPKRDNENGGPPVRGPVSGRHYGRVTTDDGVTSRARGRSFGGRRGDPANAVKSRAALVSAREKVVAGSPPLFRGLGRSGVSAGRSCVTKAIVTPGDD